MSIDRSESILLSQGGIGIKVKVLRLATCEECPTTRSDCELFWSSEPLPFLFTSKARKYKNNEFWVFDFVSKLEA